MLRRNRQIREDDLHVNERNSAASFLRMLYSTAIRLPRPGNNASSPRISHNIIEYCRSVAVYQVCRRCSGCAATSPTQMYRSRCRWNCNGLKASQSTYRFKRVQILRDQTLEICIVIEILRNAVHHLLWQYMAHCFRRQHLCSHSTLDAHRHSM